MVPQHLHCARPLSGLAFDCTSRASVEVETRGERHRRIQLEHHYSSNNITVQLRRAVQYMMYCKALFFHDTHSASLVKGSPDPAVQKASGVKIRGWDAFLWRGVCERVAFEGNLVEVYLRQQRRGRKEK